MLIMGYYTKDRKPIKKCPISNQPIMKSWGIGEGRPPLTSDPENPIKLFAEYETDDRKDDD